MKRWIKDVIIFGIFIAMIISTSIQFLCTNGINNLSGLFGQLILLTLGFTGLINIFQYCNFRIFIPNLLLKEKQSQQNRDINNLMYEYFKNESTF
ncbi:hypothetical protein [Clostridium kluyveri]|uniref:Uncharacterized protein n=1 Tax=Clostridium kluyveri (strain ATCC 8527 / DSM 555 / NBRC 12016 / NCIMB 10680 / K1) TaxID=431943 RepID=A5MZB9_CLOK5|nr:hypothetical protein [Clostridium kluyveri]EDK34215.1 Hypothetical protein CKL_2203 [Clostridium kluyveri DSM 555]